ncbi:MAG TPA: AMP-binding protein [Candidatus Eisenbacteria bacterium]|nr:AMP-binding protein [Candidatus Eisenbacteria bacterium]
MRTFSPLLPTSPAFVHYQARRRGTAGGVVFGDRRYAYGELATAVDDLAGWLARRGLGSGDAIGVMAANEPAIVAMLYAVWGLGAVVVPVSTRATAEEVGRQLEHARARALLCDTKRVAVARDGAAAIGIPLFACEPALPLHPAIVRRPRRRLRGRPRSPRAEALAAIAYTSGSSGSPKGVMLTHRNFFWAGLACAQARGDTPQSVGACMSALTHVPVLVSHLLCRIFLGSTAVLLEKFDVDSVLEAAERWAVTDLPLIGGMVFEVTQRADVPVAVRRSVQKVSVGGAPTPMEAKRRLAALFDGAEVIEAYGQTESTDGLLMARGTSVFDREGTVGTMNPHVHVGIRRVDGSLAAAGEEGEIVVGGPTVMAGYFRNPQATRAALRDGWLHTGDLGRCDADGYFFLTGRVKDIIITGGENVVPLEVEEVLRQHPDVADVAVIGTPHPKWGEQVTAIVVMRDGSGLDRDSLAAFAGERLAGFKKPRRIEFVASLPRNAYNKVQMHVLRQEFGAP